MARNKSLLMGDNSNADELAAFDKLIGADTDTTNYPDRTSDDNSENFDNIVRSDSGNEPEEFPGGEPEVDTTSDTLSTEVVQAGELDQFEQHMRRMTIGIMSTLSRCEGVEYEDGQAGDCIFTMDDILGYFYRLNVAKSDAELAAYVSRLVKSGFFVKAGRGKYQASTFLQRPPSSIYALVMSAANGFPTPR